MWRIESYKNDKSLGKSNGHEDKRAAIMILYSPERSINLPLYMYLGTEMSKCSHVIFSVHGVHRNARKYRDIFIDSVQDKNVLIVSPRLSDPYYNHPLALTVGGVRRGLSDKFSVLEEDWTFTHLYEVFHLLQSQFHSLKRFSIFGHSAGAQFAHRMLLMNNYPEISTVVAANPGWLTVLDEDIRFPYGLKNMAVSFSIEEMLKKRLVLLAGTEDVYIDPYLRTSRRAMAQGNNRYERALYAYSSARRLAEQNSYEFNWQFLEAKKVGHNSSLMAPLAIKYLLS